MSGENDKYQHTMIGPNNICKRLKLVGDGHDILNTEATLQKPLHLNIFYMQRNIWKSL